MKCLCHQPKNVHVQTVLFINEIDYRSSRWCLWHPQTLVLPSSILRSSTKALLYEHTSSGHVLLNSRYLRGRFDWAFRHSKLFDITARCRRERFSPTLRVYLPWAPEKMNEYSMLQEVLSRMIKCLLTFLSPNP